MSKAFFAPYGEPPTGPNNLTPGLDWPSSTSPNNPPHAPFHPASSAGSDATSASAPNRFLLSEPNQKGPRTYFTTATQINMVQDIDQRSAVSFFKDTSGPGTELVPNAPDGSRFLPKLILLSLVRRWSIITTGVIRTNKWGAGECRALVAPVFKDVMVAGTPQHASYIWALFYLLALKMLEAMTVDVLMGTMLPPSRYAIKVLGKASGSIVRFEEKFRFCLTLALTKVLVSGKGEFPAMDDWDFGPEEAKITSKSNPFCRWIWAELSRLGQEFLIHLRFKLRMFGKDVIEDFPPMLGPNNIPATSAVRAKYDLIRATEDLGLNLQRFFDIPPANFLQDPRALQARNGVTQPSISMIMSDALLNLTKALIKIVGDDQAAFALWLRSGRKSCAMSHKIFVLPAVFLAARTEALRHASGYQGADSFVIQDDSTELFEVEEKFMGIYGKTIAVAMQDGAFAQAIEQNLRAIQNEANFESMIRPLS